MTASEHGSSLAAACKGPDLTPKEMSDDLKTIARLVQSWIDFNVNEDKTYGIETTDGTHVMRVPYWPTIGSLSHWVKALNRAADEITASAAVIECHAAAASAASVTPK